MSQTENVEAKYNRPSWDEYFILIMEAIAKRATCDRGRSGCVIAKDKQLIAAGYVGSAIGDDHCDDVGHLMQKRYNADGTYSEHCVRTVHAEQNAICQAAKRGISVEGATLYCRMTPCPVCAKMIANCGIKRVVCQRKYHDGAEAERVFGRSGIALIFQSEDEEDYAAKGTAGKQENNKEEKSPVIENDTKLKIKKLHPSAEVPEFAREGDAGLDLFAIEGVSVGAGERVSISTGIAMEIPENHVGLIWDRGGVSFKKGLKVIAGVVDSGFRGEIKVIMANISSEPVEIMQGDKIAQMIIQPFERPEIEISNELSQTERGDKMFGSSDEKVFEESEEPEEIEEPTPDDYEVLEATENDRKEENGSQASRW